ncbi:hypothetical protein [Rhodococcus opacus]|uniref:hypothetical protein n=1 Tax=Rhodococcus opacus TaxID=37919 RepID=UPI001E347BC4|nr:hypothetical protein [Rhodococcus opacus]
MRLGTNAVNRTEYHLPRRPLADVRSPAGRIRDRRHHPHRTRFEATIPTASKSGSAAPERPGVPSH